MLYSSDFCLMILILMMEIEDLVVSLLPSIETGKIDRASIWFKHEAEWEHDLWRESEKTDCLMSGEDDKFILFLGRNRVQKEYLWVEKHQMQNNNQPFTSLKLLQWMALLHQIQREIQGRPQFNWLIQQWILNLLAVDKRKSHPDSNELQIRVSFWM